MNHWKETAEIVSRLEELAAAGQRAALATVVRIVGSAYRRPGAKFLIEESGGTLGSVSGGCLEADVREVAMAVIATEQPWLRHYHTGDDDVVWGLGLGCNGQVDVFVQPATAGPLATLAGRLRQLFTGDAGFALATVVSGTGTGGTLLIEPRGGGCAPMDTSGSLGSPDLDQLAMAHAHGLLGQTAPAPGAGLGGGGALVVQAGDSKLFVEALPPPPHLIVCGAGEDARPLVAYAADAGFRVSVYDHRPALLAAEWFPQAARRTVARPESLAALAAEEDPGAALPPAGRSLAVVKTHSLAHDREWARRLLAAGVPYVGLLGPRARTESILRDIGAPGDERVFGPVGLDLGADGPRQVAISIVAELLGVIARREPRHLSQRAEAIHVG
jgi:xanthine dehydrogenase accessory factor